MNKNLVCGTRDGWMRMPDLFGGLLEDFFSGPTFASGLLTPSLTGGSAGWVPSVDVKENDEEYTVYASLPGLKKEDIRVSVENNVLTLSGEYAAKQEESDDGWIHRENRGGRFTRRPALRRDRKDPARTREGGRRSTQGVPHDPCRAVGQESDVNRGGRQARTTPDLWPTA